MYAKAKLLILTDRGTYEGFLKLSDGKVGEGIEMEPIPLPPELQLLAEEVRQMASREMTSGSRDCSDS